MKKNNGKKNSLTTGSKIAAGFMGLLLISGLLYGISFFAAGKNTLPVLGEPGHRAGAFAFTNQDGKSVTDQSVQHKVTVAEYFFTSCPSICPVMNTNLKQVYEKFKTNPDFVILSHTVDPDKDSVSVLKAYADRLEAQAPGWEFLTGNKRALYAGASQDYLLSAADSGTGQFVHTQYVALLDKSRQIRGFYDMSRKENIVKLETDIQQLLSNDSN
jgi:protein SCO1